MTRTRIALAATSALLLLSLSSCSSGPDEYEGRSACGVKTAIVTSVLGTDRFEVSDSDGGPLPLELDSPRYSCLVEGSDDAQLDVSADVKAVDPIETMPESATAFSHGGGHGVLLASGAAWSCGKTYVVANVRAASDKPTADRLKGLITALADEVGCVRG
jgi:hypothetical protein